MNLVPVPLLIIAILFCFAGVRFGMGRFGGLFGAAAITKTLSVAGGHSMFRGLIVISGVITIIAFVLGSLIN